MLIANRKRFTIGLYLLTGALPWGVALDDRCEVAPRALSKCGDRWILCCGHTLTDEDVAEWKAERLLLDGSPDTHGRPTVVAGPRLESWISDAWHGLRVGSWGRPR